VNSTNLQKAMITFIDIVALYLAFSLFFSLLGYDSSFLYPGGFLLNCFGLTAFYVPVMLFLFALLAGRETFSARSFFSLSLSILPFFTVALLMNMYGEQGPAALYFVLSFGRTMGTVLLLMLAAIEILLIIKGGEYLFNREENSTSKETSSLTDKWESLRNIFFNFFGIDDLPGEDSHSEISKKNDQRVTHQFEDDEDVEWQDVKLTAMTPPEFPSPANPVPRQDYMTEKGDDPVQEMIQQVLTGKMKETSPSRLPMVPPPPSQQMTPPEFPQEDNDQDNKLDNPLVEPEEEIKALGGYEEEFYPVTSEEIRLEHLIKDLDEAIIESEEDRPESIADKLAPEDNAEGSFFEKSPRVNHKKIRKGAYKVPVEGILATYPDEGSREIDEETRRSASILEETLREFKIEAEVTGISRGPVITMFELLPAPGVKLNRIVALQDNIALRLAASRVRIVAPIPGKHAVGIEIPNKKRSIVAFSDLVMDREMKKKDIAIPIVLGEDISGDSQVIDLARTPHLLIAGSTGSGKSVSVNSLICSILYHRSPEDVKMILVDPKIVELKLYNDIPHLLTPVITEPKRAFQAIQWALSEMENRYALLDGMGVRDIKTYNKRILEREIATTKLPYIVLVIDEFADLMATSGKELEGIIARLAAMSRAVGIHLVLATQRPSTDVITGLIKANFPSRIAFMVASMTDSRIIIDSAGAEKLLGRGDMLFTSSWDPFPSRVQGAFLSEEEVERVVTYVKTLGEPDYIDDEIFIDEPDDDFELRSDDGVDSLYDDALEVVIESGKASASYLQRRLKIGYNRAARLVEDMEMRGIVGPANGSKAREIIHVPT
jgi:S-DNA-T family DNA segregation ATPase FtsK/SpoIIIE